MENSLNQKILILGYHDFPFEGHGYSLYKHLQEEGHEVYYVSYISEYTDNPYFFLNTHKDKLIYRINRRVISLILFLRRLFFKRLPDKNEYCFFNTSNYYIGNAKKILNKVGIIPDVIIFAWCDFFISPKVIYDLYILTKAKIIISMVDPHFLGGGCHFPCDCKQYKTGCKNCPVLVKPDIAKKLYEDKVKYLSDIPMIVAGSPYDIMRAKTTSFLKKADFVKIVTTPEIPYVINKQEARTFFNIPKDDFVLFWGAQYTYDKRKGFSFLMEALDIFVNYIYCKRRVSVLILANDRIDESNYNLGGKVTILQPGFLDQKGLFAAFYASDLFVSTSIDDSGPMTVNYSLSCGRPVISFPVGIAVDLVKNGETGYLAKFMDADDLAKGFNLFYSMKECDYNCYSNNCFSMIRDIKKSSKPWYLTMLG